MWYGLFRTAIYLGILQLAFSVELRCYKNTVDDYVVKPVEQADELIKSDCFNITLCTRFFIFGYRGSSVGDETIKMITALINELFCNVVLVDWSAETNTIIKTPVTGVLFYPEVALVEVKIVSDKLATAVALMVANGMNEAITQIIGHSLGAHIAGMTGRKLKEQDIVLPRIVGLDPARQFFDMPALATPVNKDDAEMVECVHTDQGGYGLNSSNCCVDIYVRKTADDIQPGCPTGFQVFLTDPDQCSHVRAIDLFVDSLKNPTSLIGCYALTYGDWLGGKGDTQTRAYIRDEINTCPCGNYFINVTNPSPTYGQGEAGLNP